MQWLGLRKYKQIPMELQTQDPGAVGNGSQRLNLELKLVAFSIYSPPGPMASGPRTSGPMANRAKAIHVWPYGEYFPSLSGQIGTILHLGPWPTGPSTMGQLPMRPWPSLCGHIGIIPRQSPMSSLRIGPWPSMCGHIGKPPEPMANGPRPNGPIANGSMANPVCDHIGNIPWP